MTLQSLDTSLYNVKFKHHFLCSSQPKEKKMYNLNTVAIIIATQLVGLFILSFETHLEKIVSITS